MDDNKCGFCHTGEDSSDICGSLHKDTFEGKTIVAHHKCMQYSAMLVQYKSDKFGGFKKHQVLDEIRRGSRLICSLCKNDKAKKNKKGASSGCALKTCRKTFHYYCVSMAPNTVAKRYRVAAGQKVVILYRVFCSKKHEELYRKNLKAEDVVGSQASSSESEAGESGDDETDNRKPSDDDDDDDDDDNQDDDDYDDDTEVEPVHKKRRAAAQMDTEEEEDGEGQAGLGSPPMTPDEVVSETRKEYNSLLNRSQRSRGSPDYSNNGDDYEGGGSGLVTDVSASSPSETDVSAHATGQTSKGMFILIPSKLEVGDLKSFCQHTGYSVENSALWPRSPETRSRLQDTHLPFVMWDIATKLRKQDKAGVSNIFLDVNVSQYECLHAFHSQPSDEEDEAIHKRLFNATSEVNCIFKKEVCRLVNLTVNHTKMFILILSLPKSYIASIETTVFFNLHKWSPETVCSSFDAKSLRAGYEHEKKQLLKLLKHKLRGRDIELSVYPQDAILGNIGDLCVVRDIEFKIQTMPSGSGKSVKVLVVRNVDRSVVQYKAYLHKLLLWFLHERDGCEAYCVLSVKPGDGVRTLSDVLPDKVKVGDVHVYSAFPPQARPTTCLLLHCPPTHTSLPNGKGAADDNEDASFRVPDSQPSVYMDNAESQDSLCRMSTPRRSLRR